VAVGAKIADADMAARSRQAIGGQRPAEPRGILQMAADRLDDREAGIGGNAELGLYLAEVPQGPELDGKDRIEVVLSCHVAVPDSCRVGAKRHGRAKWHPHAPPVSTGSSCGMRNRLREAYMRNRLRARIKFACVEAWPVP